MEEGQKYLVIHLRNKMQFDVKGESANDIPSNVIRGLGFSQFERLYGGTIQILASEIVAIEEAQQFTEPIPW